MNKEIKVIRNKPTEANDRHPLNLLSLVAVMDGEKAIKSEEYRVLYEFIRTALEEYKPKTVSREWVGDFIYGTYERLSRNDQEAAEEYALGLLKDEGIEVEGDK